MSLLGIVTKLVGLTLVSLIGLLLLMAVLGVPRFYTLRDRLSGRRSPPATRV